MEQATVNLMERAARLAEELRRRRMAVQGPRDPRAQEIKTLEAELASTWEEIRCARSPLGRAPETLKRGPRRG